MFEYEVCIVCFMWLFEFECVIGYVCCFECMCDDVFFDVFSNDLVVMCCVVIVLECVDVLFVGLCVEFVIVCYVLVLVLILVLFVVFVVVLQLIDCLMVFC